MSVRFRGLRVSLSFHEKRLRCLGDVDGMAAGLVLLLLVLGVARAVGAVAAAGTTAVELDAVALAGDAVALAGAGGAVGVGGAVAGERGRGRRAVGAVGQGAAGGGDGRGAEVGEDVLVIDAGGAEAGGELIDLLVVVVVRVQDVLGRVGRHGLGGLDLRSGQGAALGDLDGEGAAGARRGLVLGGGARRALAAGLGGRLGRGRRRRLGGRLGHIEDVQLTAGGGLDGRVLAGVVGNVVAINDVVVPVALAGLEGRGLEPEGALPGLGGRLVLGKGKLADVVVPRAEEMDGLDAGGDAEGEAELSGRHFEDFEIIKLFLFEKILVLMREKIDFLE